MIIRKLNPQEKYKSAIVSSIAFNYSSDIKSEKENELKDDEIIGAFCDDNETLMAQIVACHFESRFGNTYLPSLGIGGVSTLPEYRRNGCIKAIFNHLFKIAPERNWATSFLYPFSYSYYRKYGYERVIQFKSIEFPISTIEFIPKSTNVKLYNNETNLNEVLSIYNKYCENINVMFKRTKTQYYSIEPNKDKKYTYIWYSNYNKPSSYVTFYIDDDKINVKEIAYIDYESLIGILGFLRMYEGQVNSIKLTDLPLDTHIEHILKHYSHCEYKVYNGAMGRILNVETILKNNIYPNGEGHFSLKVDDYLEYNRGIFDVEYSKGEVSVTKREDNGNYDICSQIPSLTKIMLGYDNFNFENSEFLDGIEFKSSAKDFFNAFPKRNMGLWDRF